MSLGFKLFPMFLADSLCKLWILLAQETKKTPNEQNINNFFIPFTPFLLWVHFIVH